MWKSLSPGGANRTRRVLGAAILVGSFAVPAWAEDPVPAVPAPQSVAPPEVEPDVVEELRRVAALLTNAPKLSFRAEISYDAVQRDGQKIEFGATRRTLLRRPDRIFMDAERRDGSHQRLFFDGQALSFLDVGQNAYAVAPKTGDIDAAIDYLVDDLGTPFPLSDLLRNDLSERVTDGLTIARFAGEEEIAGVPTDHVALRKPAVDIQLWIAHGDKPLVRRVVITYRDAPGQPQFRADLSDWNFAPDASDARFAFRPPKDAEKIPFALRGKPPLPASGSKPAEGEQP